MRSTLIFCWNESRLMIAFVGLACVKLAFCDTAERPESGNEMRRIVSKRNGDERFRPHTARVECLTRLTPVQYDPHLVNPRNTNKANPTLIVAVLGSGWIDHRLWGR